MFAIINKYNIVVFDNIVKNKFQQIIKKSVLNTNYFLNIIK